MAACVLAFLRSRKPDIGPLPSDDADQIDTVPHDLPLQRRKARAAGARGAGTTDTKSIGTASREEHRRRLSACEARPKGKRRSSARAALFAARPGGPLGQRWSLRLCVARVLPVVGLRR